MKKTIQMLLITIITVIGVTGVSAKTYSCYQCTGDTSIYKWGTSGASDDTCGSGYVIRNDISERDCRKKELDSGKGDINIGMYEYGVYCAYQNDYYFKYSGSSLDNQFHMETNIPNAESGRPLSEPVGSIKEQEWLKSKGILDANTGLFMCPTNPFGAEIGASTQKICGLDYCMIDLIETPDETNTCIYKGQESGSELTIVYTYDDDGVKWTITYPDGSTKVLTNMDGNMLSMGRTCEDIYYDKNNNTIHTATSSNISINQTLSKLCNKYNGNTNNIEHYCSGSCNFSNMACSVTVACGGTNGIPVALPIFIHNIITIIKIAVPIILVIMGMLDFAKAVISSDEKGMKDTQSKFVKRIIGAVSIFLVVTIVQLVFNIVNTDDTNEMASCIDCFINGDCNRYTVFEYEKND